MASEGPSLESVKRCIADGDLEGAEALLLDLLHEDSTAPNVLHTLAKLYSRMRRLDESISVFKQLVTLVPNKAVPYFELGNACLAKDRMDDAIRAFRQGLALDRSNPQAHNNLGIALKRQGAIQEAEASFRAAVGIAPQLALPHRNLGELSRIRGNRRQALQHFENAIRIDPNDAESHNGLGMTAASLASTEKAILHFRKAIELSGTHREAENNLAILLSATGQSDEAIELFRHLIGNNPEFVTARINLGSILIELGQFEEAVEHLEVALRLKPDSALALHHLGDLSLADEYQFTEAQMAQMKMLLDSGGNPSENRIAIGFTYAGILEKQKRFADAFDIYQKANFLNHQASQRKDIVFDASLHEKKMQQAIAFFNNEFFDSQKQRGVSSDSETPVFVVGMPRSGTTLIEQIISSHPEASGAGELAAIEEVSLQISAITESANPYPECLGDLSRRAGETIQQQYLDKLSKNRSPSRRIVDKTWYNFYFLGLIATLFPKARVIHCLRDPRDVALSCFFSNFNSIHWSWRMGDIIAYYKSYRTIMKHWENTLPIEVLDVQYEELIANQESISQRIIDFCGLDWNEDCLNFYKSPRSVQTASRVQVRKPIYTKSVGRWKSFENELSKIPEWNENLDAS